MEGGLALLLMAMLACPLVLGSGKKPSAYRCVSFVKTYSPRELHRDVANFCTV